MPCTTKNSLHAGPEAGESTPKALTSGGEERTLPAYSATDVASGVVLTAGEGAAGAVHAVGEGAAAAVHLVGDALAAAEEKAKQAFERTKGERQRARHFILFSAAAC